MGTCILEILEMANVIPGPEVLNAHQVCGIYPFTQCHEALIGMAIYHLCLAKLGAVYYWVSRISHIWGVLKSWGIPSRHHGCFNIKKWSNDRDDLGPPFWKPPYVIFKPGVYPNCLAIILAIFMGGINHQNKGGVFLLNKKKPYTLFTLFWPEHPAGTALGQHGRFLPAGSAAQNHDLGTYDSGHGGSFDSLIGDLTGDRIQGYNMKQYCLWYNVYCICIYIYIYNQHYFVCVYIYIGVCLKVGNWSPKIWPVFWEQIQKMMINSLHSRLLGYRCFQTNPMEPAVKLYPAVHGLSCCGLLT